MKNYWRVLAMGCIVINTTVAFVDYTGAWIPEIDQITSIVTGIVVLIYLSWPDSTHLKNQN